MQLLKYETSATVLVGPFVDKDDGVTPETGLAAGTVDEIGVYKHDATSLTDISGTTTFTHRAGGMYTMTLSTGDTGTAGRLTAYVRDDSVCLPVWKDFMVLPANVYDSLVGGTDYLDVDAYQVTDDAVTAAAIADGAVDAATFAAGAISAAALAADAGGEIADAVWDEQLSGHATAGSAGEAQSGARVADHVWDEVIEAGAPANAQTARQMLRIALAVLVGADGEESDWSALALDGSKVRVSGTLSASGARQSVGTLDGS